MKIRTITIITPIKTSTNGSNSFLKKMIIQVIEKVTKRSISYEKKYVSDKKEP
jgi:hypothetical protein